MSGIERAGRLKATTMGLIVLVLTAGTVSAFSQINTSPTSGPQNTTSPPRFGPARPSPGQSPAAFTPDMPFGQAIDILRNSTWPPLNIVVLWRELEANAGVDRNTTIGIDSLRGLRLRQCLEVLLNSVSATAPVKIGYTVDHGVITVATVDSLPKPKRVTRVYDISDLVAPPSQPMGFGMMPGMMSGMMPGMMPGFGGGMSYGGYGGYGSGLGGGYSPGYGGGYNSGYGGYGQTSGYGPSLPGFIGGYQGMGVFGR